MVLTVKMVYFLNLIYFDFVNVVLGKFYGKIFNNDNFRKTLGELGFTYKDNIEGEFVFTRK